MKNIPLDFLKNDGPSIIAALKAVDIDPWACRVKRINITGSPVYSVNRMGKFKWGNKLNVDGIAMDKIGDFALKLVETPCLFDDEHAALSAIAAVAQKQSAQFHALGSIKFKEIPLDSGDGKESESSEEGADHPSVGKKNGIDDNGGGGNFPLTIYNEDLWGIINNGGDHSNDKHTALWWQFPGLSVTQRSYYGAIYMRVGRPVEDTASPKELANGVSASLELTHQAGYLHSDIRKSKVLLFDKIGYRLVDFGLSCGQNSGKYDLGPGAQRDSVGNRIRNCLDKGIPFEWTVTDDYQMLLSMITNLGERQGRKRSLG